MTKLVATDTAKVVKPCVIVDQSQALPPQAAMLESHPIYTLCCAFVNALPATLRSGTSCQNCFRKSNLYCASNDACADAI